MNREPRVSEKEAIKVSRSLGKHGQPWRKKDLVRMKVSTLKRRLAARDVFLGFLRAVS